MGTFERQLEIGKAGESEIARWLMSRGHNILPVYEKVDCDYKGPTVFSANGDSFIAPDLLCFSNGNATWIEAKHKTAFTWHRKTGRFVTGVDQHHFDQYQEVQELIDWPVWLLFLHQGGQAKDSPPSPSGLFGGDIKTLAINYNHKYEKWGKTGMIYWEPILVPGGSGQLKKLSNYPLVST